MEGEMDFEPTDEQIAMATKQILHRMKYLDKMPNGEFVPNRRYMRLSDKKLKRLRNKIMPEVVREARRIAMKAFVDEELERMQKDGLVEIGSDDFVKVTEKGKKFFESGKRTDVIEF